MIDDARRLARGETINADLCIVGAGAAGITIARTLAEQSLSVVLLESGGLEFDAAIQELYAGEAVALNPYSLDGSRLRYFGGTTNHWAGFCRPLDRIDFEPRPWVADSGWPISVDDLARHYVVAQELCQIGPMEYDAAAWARRINRTPFQPLPIAPTAFRSSIFQYSPPTRFGTVFRSALQRASKVRVLLYANATNIEMAGDLVAGIDVQAWQSTSFQVRARAYVLACGGIENARLLLASNRSRPQGVGNEQDLVGRYFADHPILETGEIALGAGSTAMELYDGWRAGGIAAQAVLVLAEEAMQREALLNGGFFLFPVFDDEQSAGFQALLDLVHEAERGEFPDNLGTKLQRILADLDGVMAPALRRLLRRGRKASRVQLRLFSEQTPNRDSRVTLAPERDALGMPRARLQWRLSQGDHRSFEKTFELLGRAFGSRDLGRIRYDLAEAQIVGGSHHIGTTRMSDDARTGVVDADCRVHGVANLSIAGSSVFPTTGCSNPTLTLVALAHRLAERLGRELR